MPWRAERRGGFGFRRSRVLRYGGAFLAVVLALLVRLLLDPILGQRFLFIPFLIAILGVQWLGFGPSLAAWGLSLLLAAYFFFEPRHSLRTEGAADQLGFMLDACAGLIVVIAAELWRRTVRLGTVVKAEQRLGQELAESRRGVSHYSAEMIFERPDGSRVTILKDVEPIRDAEGTITGVISTLADITARKEAERQRQKATGRLELLSDLASQLLASERPQEIVNSLCQRVMRHLGCHVFFNYLLDREQNRLHLNTCYGVDAEVARRLEWLDLGQIACGWVGLHAEPLVVENVHLSGDARVALLRAMGCKLYACYPLMAQGQLIGTLCMVSLTRTSLNEDELTLIQTVSHHVAIAIQRMQLMESIRQRAAEAEEGRRVLQALMEHIPMGIAIADAETMKLRIVSRAGREMPVRPADVLDDIPLDEVVSRWNVLHADGVTRAAFEEIPLIRAVKRGEVIREAEFLAVTEDGRQVPILVNAAPIRDAEGRITGAVAGWLDVTRRKQAEEALKAAREDLEVKVRQRTEQLAFANRELETLNQTLKQRAQQLQAMAMELTQSEERERRRLAQVLHDHLQQILVAARMKVALFVRHVEDERQRQAALQIDELIDQCISESRSLTVELSPPVLYDRGLAPALEWLARQMEEKHGLEVRARTEPEAEPADHATKILLFQAVRELLFNVVKHARATLAEVEMTRTDQDQIRLTVHDNGQGFDPALTTQGHGGRSGFGLFSIRERLERIGGSLEIEAAPGEGSRMTIAAPLEPLRPVAGEVIALEVPVAREAIVEPRGAVTEGAVIRVLLADDHPILRKGLADVLDEQPEIELVGEATDGEEVIEMARRMRPDVVVMDVTMPKINGIEATRRITAELPQVRVIGLSMHEQSDMASAMREAGAVAYLSKTHPTEVLLSIILHPFQATKA